MGRVPVCDGENQRRHGSIVAMTPSIDVTVGVMVKRMAYQQQA